MGVNTAYTPSGPGKLLTLDSTWRLTMDNIPIITKRRLQAEVIGPVFDEMSAQLGQQKAEDILRVAIQKAAIAEGQHFAATPVISFKLRICSSFSLRV